MDQIKLEQSESAKPERNGARNMGILRLIASLRNAVNAGKFFWEQHSQEQQQGETMTLCDICKKEIPFYGDNIVILETGETVHKSCYEEWQKNQIGHYRGY